MKKFISALLVLMLCVAMPLSTFASADEFVPSVTYKDAPEISSATMDGVDISASVAITSLLDAQDGNGAASDEAIQLLLNIYEQLTDGTMDMPVEGDFVVRDLFDISLTDPALIEKMADVGYVDIVFDLGDYDLSKLAVMNYHDEQWHQVEVIDNGDGTITCRFTHFSPVAFLELEEGAKVDISAPGKNLGLWIGICVVAAAAIIAVVVIYRRKIFR